MAVRKTPRERIDELNARKKEIEAQLASLEAREKEASRKRDARRKIVVGAAVLAHAELDADFEATLRAILKKAVVRPADKAAISDFLTGEADSKGYAA